jgi:hypothetical protein
MSVLIYRLISLWAVLAVGWLCWFGLRTFDRRLTRGPTSALEANAAREHQTT